MKKFFLVSIIVIFAAVPFFAGHYVEMTFRQRIESLSPELKLQHFQRGYFSSTADVIAENGEIFHLTFKHAPLILTGIDIARGQVEDLNFTINFKREINVVGKVNIQNFQAEIQSYGNIENYPQTSTTTLKTQTYHQDKILLYPFSATIYATGGTLSALVPELRFEKTGDFSLRFENIRKKEINAGGDEFSAEKIYWKVPDLDLETAWRNVAFSQRIKTAENGETVSYFLHFSGKQDHLSAGGAMQFFIAPLRSIIPDSINADLTIHGIDKSDRNLFFQDHFHKDEWLNILKKNLVSQKMSADFQADLLRHGEGLKINLHLKENINFDNVNLLNYLSKELFIGSSIEVDLANSVVNNAIFKSFINPNPSYFLELNGFFHNQSGWHLRGKIDDHGNLQFKRGLQ